MREMSNFSLVLIACTKSISKDLGFKGMVIHCGIMCQDMGYPIRANDSATWERENTYKTNFPNFSLNMIRA